MNKKIISKGARQLVTVLLVGLLVISAAGLAWGYNAPTEQIEEYTAYAYRQETDLDYRVHLFPNTFFQNTARQPDRAYITALTNRLSTDFEYRFSGESDAEVSGEYSVTATLAAFTSREGQLVWEKDYLLLPVKSFKKSDGEVNLQESVTIPLAEYLAFAEQVKEETGFNPGELKLMVHYDINLEAETGSGVVEEALSPALMVILGGNTFTVEGNQREETSGGITDTRITAVPQVFTARRLFPVTTGVLVVLLTAFIFLTTSGEEKTSPWEKKLSGILKKHGERIVTTTGGVSSNPEGAFTVSSFEELLKVADEFSRPILYPRAEGAKGCHHTFLVFTPEHVYLYDAGKRSDPS